MLNVYFESQRFIVFFSNAYCCLNTGIPSVCLTFKTSSLLFC